MKIVVYALVGAVSGAVAGLVLSEVIAVMGLAISGEPGGVRYLPLYLAALFAVGAAGLAGVRSRRR